MDRFTRLVENTTNVEKQKCLRELGELVDNLASTSINGKIINDGCMRNAPRTELTPLLKSDGSIDDVVPDDVNLRMECLLGLWKLKRPRTYDNEEDYDSDDEEVYPVSEVAEISARYFVSFGVQLVAASCGGNLSWMKALLRLGANPNEAIISDTRHRPLTAFTGCVEYAPEETRVDGLKLLSANRSEESEFNILSRYTGRHLYENGFSDILLWLDVPDCHWEFQTDLQRAARHCDHQRMKVSKVDIWG